MCKTRWIARHDALSAFNQLFEAVVNTLKEIGSASSDAWSSDSKTQANGLLAICTSFHCDCDCHIDDHDLHQGEL